MNYYQFQDENVFQEYNIHIDDVQKMNNLIKSPLNSTYPIVIKILKNCQIPPRQYLYDIDIDNYDTSLRQLFYIQQLPIQYNWNDEQNLTIFDQACFSEIPDITGHRSNEQDPDGFTVAMILASNDIDVPKQWYHDPQLRNKYGQTVGIIQAKRKLFVQQQWVYMKQKNKQQQWYSASYVLSLEGIISHQLQYDNILNKNEKNIILQQLAKHNILIINNQQYFNVKCYRNFAYCDLCNDNQCNYFVMNNHNHTICAICYTCILEQKQSKQFENKCKVKNCNINVKFCFTKLIKASQQNIWYKLYDYINSYDKISILYKNKLKRQLLCTNETEFSQNINQVWLNAFQCN